MMNKTNIIVISTFIVLFLLTACNATPAETTAPTTAPVVTEPAETTAPTTAPVVTEPTEIPPSTSSATELPEIGPIIVDFSNMDEMQLKEWFLDFSRVYRLDYLPRFPLTMGPPTEPRAYMSWIHVIHLEDMRAEKLEMTTDLVEKTVQTYFGITPGPHQTYENAWDYDESAQVYTIYPAGSFQLPSHVFFLLQSLEQEGELYTVHATWFQYKRELTQDELLSLDMELLQGNSSLLYPYAEVTLSFQIDPDTQQPFFYGCTQELLVS